MLFKCTTTEKSKGARRCLIVSCHSLCRDPMPHQCSSFPRPHRRARSAIPLPIATLHAAIQCFLNTLHVNAHRGLYARVLDVMIHSHLRKGTYRYCGMHIRLSLLSRSRRLSVVGSRAAIYSHLATLFFIGIGLQMLRQKYLPVPSTGRRSERRL
jgi:hypothetical protein